MPRIVNVTAASRLHFGMFSFGNPQRRQFGGVGVMLARPGLQLRLEPAPQFTVEGHQSDRVKKFSLAVTDALHLPELPNVRVTVLQVPPQHVGLGVGTALGMSVAAALCRWTGQDEPSTQRLAQLAGRGRRSAVGAYGFSQGGLIVEPGKYDEPLAPLAARVTLPESWRFVLLRPDASPGLSGMAERRAFAALPAVPDSTTDRLCREALLHLVPAAQQANFAEFSESLYRFGALAGECFASQQAGVFATEQLADMVARLRDAGFAGVGQSSWGPTLFVAARNSDEAEQVARLAAESSKGASWQTTISPVANTGATIECQ